MRLEKARAAVAALMALCTAGPAAAHRLDEYLQATLLSIEADRVQVSMRLVPGQMIASAVIEGIDTDHDGRLSQREQQAYAQSVLADQAIVVDGKSASPRLVSWQFPSPAQMRDGLGEIHIAYAVTLPRRDGAHRFGLVNRHRSNESVYLVNVLAPADARTRVVHQQRDALQSRYELDFRQDVRNRRLP